MYNIEHCFVAWQQGHAYFFMHVKKPKAAHEDDEQAMTAICSCLRLTEPDKKLSYRFRDCQKED